MSKPFPIGRRDTLEHTQTVRQGRRTFFLKLEQLAPKVMEELRALPKTKQEGKVINAADKALPRLDDGAWYDLRPIALPPDVAKTLQDHFDKGRPAPAS